MKSFHVCFHNHKNILVSKENGVFASFSSRLKQRPTLQDTPVYAALEARGTTFQKLLPPRYFTILEQRLTLWDLDSITCWRQYRLYRNVSERKQTMPGRNLQKFSRISMIGVVLIFMLGTLVIFIRFES